jgi:hypothetical protein
MGNPLGMYEKLSRDPMEASRDGKAAAVVVALPTGRGSEWAAKNQKRATSLPSYH